ncbi:DNA repair and recombination protein RadA [archaeon CG10_big_fil_rev_8_21_14_0_10_43_11]|nr:MAG: DNA repair and recombination protein RadA [archaeon CG10_big_fil_rev_8_21_14_0_10_43_11]
MLRQYSLEDIPGVGEKTAERLVEAGYSDLMSLAVSPIGDVMEAAELTEGAARKIIGAARHMLHMNFMSAEELLEKRKEVGKITTSSDNLNKLLGGGVETQSISEFHGEFGSGKSQVGFQLAVNAQLPLEKGGLDGDVIFIDTEGTFRPERIMQLAKDVGLKPNTVLKRIHVARAFSSDHQMLLVEKIPELIKKEGKNIKLVVVDSLMGLFRSEYIGRGTLANRQQKLNRHLHALQRLADRYNLAVYVTNQVMSRPDIFFGNPDKAVGGHILAHAATFRVYVRKSKGTKRIARLIDSPSLPEAEAVFTVDTPGIRD